MTALSRPVGRAALAILAAVLTCGPALAETTQLTDEELMEKLKGAAPPAVFENATILKMAEDGSMKAIKEGTNGWTCMDPSGTDPMCADAGGMEWGQAYMSKGAPPQKLGVIYMLREIGRASCRERV